METVTLTTPEVIPAITTTDYRVVLLQLDWEGALIVVRLRGTNAEYKGFTYEGVEATNLMIALNKANLTIKSLQRRILEKLIADGKLTGSVTGTPE